MKRERSRAPAHLVVLSLAALLALAACGTLGDADAEPAVLTTLSGALSGMDGVEVQGELRVALVWRDGDWEYVEGQTQPYHIAEDVPVTAELPARFTLALTAPPPAAAMQEITEDSIDTDFPPGSSYAVGALVVYDDRDGDGELDILDAGATTAIDELVGARGDLEIWYVAGGVPRTGHLDGGGQFDFLQLGYQLVEWDGERGRLLDSVDIPLVVEDGLRSIVCADPYGAPYEVVDHSVGELPDTFPTDPARFECRGTSFTWDRAGCRETHWDTLCPANVVCSIDLYWLADPANPPAGWPCEIPSE